jgi:prolipoprotein diacylglyceryl transferase
VVDISLVGSTCFDMNTEYIHWYGLIVGLAVVWWWTMMERVSKRNGWNASQLSKMIGVSLVGALVGGRIYHLLTDWQLYQVEWWRVFEIWRGGMSILGAVAGGLAASYWYWFSHRPNWKWHAWLDALALSLPAAHALGRLGNFVNQELYGLPSSLPWAIEIDATHRAPQWQSFSHFHPIFAYEMFFLITWNLGWWRYSLTKAGQRQFGTGWFWWWYLLGYGWWRCWLDFLRLDRGPELLGLGFNQWVLAGVTMGAAWQLVRLRSHQAHRSALSRQGLVIIACLWLLTTGMLAYQVNAYRSRFEASLQQSTTASLQGVDLVAFLRQVPDRTVLDVELGSQVLQVEIVNTPESIRQGLSGRSEIGADGMLFVLPRLERPRFWMKEMMFDLDIVWFAHDVVVDISKNVPHPDSQTPLSELPVYSPDASANVVLELVAGRSQGLGLTDGSRLKLR